MNTTIFPRLRAALGAAVLLALVLALLPATVTRAAALPGDLDPSFAGFGSRGVAVPDRLRNTNNMAVQPDGKVVVVGYTKQSGDPGVYRYLPNGQLDPSFDGDGKAAVPGGFGAYRVALDSQGRIVIGGNLDSDFMLARLTPDGAPDLSFDDDGWFQDIDDQLRYLAAILVQPDDKVVACGTAEVGGDRDFGVVRYLANGVRDTSFGGDGKVTIPFGGEDNCADLALQKDGKLILVGWRSPFLTDDDFALARLKGDGTLDTTFDGDGKLTIGFGESELADAAFVQPDGKLLVLGHATTSHTSYIVRVLPDGTLDKTFDGDGKLAIPADDLVSLALAPDGKLLALGSHMSPDFDVKFALHRLLPNGDHDTSFDSDGILFIDFGGKSDVGKALAAQPDGRVLIAGSGTNVSLLARLWPDGSFDDGGRQTSIARPGANHIVAASAVQPDDKLLVAGVLLAANNGSSDAVVTRFLPDGRVDPTFGIAGTAFAPKGFTTPDFLSAQAIALQPDGRVLAAGFATSGAFGAVDFLVARWDTNGIQDTSFGFLGSRLIRFPGNGNDEATAIALAPDGKIVVAGNVWNGARQIWGLVRLTADGALDTSFGPNHDGFAFVDFLLPNAAAALVVQPDGKIVVGGSYNGDFLLQRLLVTGAPDPSFGSNGGGYTITDFGSGDDALRALALDRDGSLLAAGSTERSGGRDIALAAYRPDGSLARCEAGQACASWPDGTRVVDLGAADQTNALLLRGDGRLVVAGCSGGQLVAAQLSASTVSDTPLVFRADFPGDRECAYGVHWSSASKNKLVATGWGGESSALITMARFVTTQDTSKLPQTISFAPLPDRLTSDPPFTLSATASSGLPVAFLSATSDVCTLTEATLSLTGQAGTCVVSAEQAGEGDYAPAPSVVRSFQVRDPAKRDQTIVFPPLPDGTVGTTAALSATASSGLPVSFRSETPAVCSLSGTTLTLLASGICTATASQAGDGAWNPAPSVSRSLAVRDSARRDQTITVQPDPLPGRLGRGETLSLQAVATSGLAVDMASLTPNMCSVAGTLVTGEAAGVCRLSLTQAGDGTWNPVRLELSLAIGAPGQRIWLPLIRHL